MTQLRIAQLANFIGPTSGGLKVAVERLGRGYVAAGAERLLVIPGPRDRITETEHGTVVEIRAPKVSSTYRMIMQPWRAMRVLERFGPTSVESSDKWTLAGVGRWAARRGIGSVLYSHERLTDMAADWLPTRFGVGSAVGLLNRRLASRFDIVAVASQYSASEWPAGTDLRVVPLGVDLETFQPGVASPPDGGPVRMCYVGRLSHEKYPQLAIATAVELHRRGVDFELNVYGTGPDLAKLRRQAAGAPVIFHGFVAGRDELAKRYAASQISLSVCPTETFGLAVLEALACGTPVVTADRGGARELVDASCGQWGSPDASSLADAVERLIGRLGPQLRTAARLRAQNYEWNRSVRQMLAIHTELAEASEGTSR